MFTQNAQAKLCEQLCEQCMPATIDRVNKPGRTWKRSCLTNVSLMPLYSIAQESNAPFNSWRSMKQSTKANNVATWIINSSWLGQKSKIASQQLEWLYARSSRSRLCPEVTCIPHTSTAKPPGCCS